MLGLPGQGYLQMRMLSWSNNALVFETEDAVRWETKAGWYLHTLLLTEDHKANWRRIGDELEGK